MSQLFGNAHTALRPSSSQQLGAGLSTEAQLATPTQPNRSASLPHISNAVDDHNDHAGGETSTDHFYLPGLPAFHLRKPSEAGLSLHTEVAYLQDAQTNVNAESIASSFPSQPKRRPAPLEPTPPPLVSRRSFGTPGGSPSSSASSPALGALGDVTPLPSPIFASQSPDVWRKVISRPHSSSSASLDRDRAAGVIPSSHLPPTPSKRKVYPNLSSQTSPSTDENLSAHQHNRSISEFVPDPLYNVRPRTVTGPSVVTPPIVPASANDTSPPLHREAYLARDRGSVDLNGRDGRVSLPSPPPSNRDTSDEDDDSSRATSAAKLPRVVVHDQISRRPISWQPLRILGNGSFSEVFLATSDSNTTIDHNSTPNTAAAAAASSAMQSLVAIKVVSHEAVKDAERMDTSIKREIEILQQISHPSLPQLYAFEDSETRALLVMNYCAGGDLFELASQHRHLLRPRLIQRIFAELVGAVVYLHSQFIVHRDIKLENVLLNLSLAYLRDLPTDPTDFPHPVVTLTDLGLSKHIPPPPASALLTHPCGSIDYAAPEVLLGQPYDGRSTDTWALGVLLYALMEGRLPFDPLPENIPNVDGAAARRRRRARASGSNVKHRIARCDWLWCEFGDGDGDWLIGAAQAQRGRELEGARECVEGMLRKVGRGRWSLEQKVAESRWVKDGIRGDGELRVATSQQPRA